jgi:SEC-C motif
VSRIGRNHPCPCGSGRKAKRCCGVARGPSGADLARAILAHHATHAAATLAHLTETELLALWRQLPELPSTDLTLHVALPELVSPELTRLYDAVLDNDADRAEDALPAVLAAVDTPHARARIAQAIVNLQTARRVPRTLAAAAHIDLASRSQLLVRASLIEAAAVAAGASRTPGGLLLAAA